jgi:hypothetical protein
MPGGSALAVADDHHTGERSMSKLLSTLTAGALALALSGFAVAADQSSGQSSSSQGSQGAGASQSSQGGGSQSGQATGQSDAYKAAMKKCDQMSGADKQKCMDQAKKKYGQM